jgi:hypothetical protein
MCRRVGRRISDQTKGIMKPLIPKQTVMNKAEAIATMKELLEKGASLFSRELQEQAKEAIKLLASEPEPVCKDSD